MKKLFCIVITDPEKNTDLTAPLVFHVNAETQDQVEVAVYEILVEDYEYDSMTIISLDFLLFEVTKNGILQLENQL